MKYVFLLTEGNTFSSSQWLACSSSWLCAGMHYQYSLTWFSCFDHTYVSSSYYTISILNIHIYNTDTYTVCICIYIHLYIDTLQLHAHTHETPYLAFLKHLRYSLLLPCFHVQQSRPWLHCSRWITMDAVLHKSSSDQLDAPTQGGPKKPSNWSEMGPLIITVGWKNPGKPNYICSAIYRGVHL